MFVLSDDHIQKIRAEILSQYGPEKYNTLIRQLEETVEKNKLRFWQQQLFESILSRTSLPIEPLDLYVAVFRNAVPTSIPEVTFVYPPSPEDALCFAVERSDLLKIEECFRLQPDVIERLESRKLPSWIICDAGKLGSAETVRLLSKLGCDLNQSDSNDFTGLGWAIGFDRYDVAKTFLDLGADPNKGTPLFNVFGSSNPLALAKLLIQYHADPHQLKICDKTSLNLVQFSLLHGQPDLATYFNGFGVSA